MQTGLKHIDESDKVKLRIRTQPLRLKATQTFRKLWMSDEFSDSEIVASFWQKKALDQWANLKKLMPFL